MARNKTMEERVKALVAELLAEEGRSGGEPENINDIEDAMVRIGDMVAREFGMQKLADSYAGIAEGSAVSPVWARGESWRGASPRLDNSPRPGPLTEAKYRCPKCRRHFFPSDGSVRT